MIMMMMIYSRLSKTVTKKVYILANVTCSSNTKFNTPKQVLYTGLKIN